MKVRDVMTRDPQSIRSDATIEDAARAMRDHRIGILPVVASDGRVVGTITDRDIAIRAVAQGLKPTAWVREAMTPGVEFCHEDDTVDDVARRMADKKLHRVVVMEEDDRAMRGIVSIGDLAIRGDDKKLVGDVLARVSVTYGTHGAHHRGGF